MEYFVNENCIGCGLCNATCPEIFVMTDSGMAQAAETEVPPAQADAAQAAMDGCPVSAIEIRS